MAKGNWIKDLVDSNATAARAAAAREEMMKLRTLKALTEGGTTGGTMATETGLAVNVPELFGVADQAALPIVTKDAGYDPANIAQAEYRGVQTNKARYEAEDSRLRTEAVGRALGDPEIDSLLAADIANKKEVAEPGRLVKVRDRAGKDVYYRERRRGVSDEFDYVPAADASTRPLQIPPGEGGDRETSEQKNIRNRSRIIQRMYPQMSAGEAEVAAYQQIAALKGKPPEESWAELVTSLSRPPYGKRDPKQLRERAAVVWSVARPNEPIPEAPAPVTTAAAAAVPGATTMPAPPRPQPVPQPAAAPRPAPAPAQPPMMINPQTGQIITLKNGQWQ